LDNWRLHLCLLSCNTMQAYFAAHVPFT
jgi:hypothetical protein